MEAQFQQISVQAAEQAAAQRQREELEAAELKKAKSKKKQVEYHVTRNAR